MKKRVLRLTAVFLIAFVLISGIDILSVHAETPYRTYTVDGYGYVQETQTAYLAHATITKFGDKFLDTPSDLYVTENGEIYVADTGNGRIIVGDLEGNLIKVIGEGTLISPKGVFVTEERDPQVD